MFEYVKNYNLQFARPLTKRAKTTKIILHHSQGGSAETVLGIHNYHLALGHRGIDYNICIEVDGDVVWGRGLEYEGGHVDNGEPETAGVNATSVGIVCLGNMDVNQMPAAQKASLLRVVADVVKYYNFTSVSQIYTHKGIAGAHHTDCPGRYFPFEDVKNYIMNGGKEVATPTPVVSTPVVTTPTPVVTKPVSAFTLSRVLRLKTKPYMSGADVKAVQNALKKAGCYAGTVDGIFGNVTDAAVKAFQKSKGLLQDGDVGAKTCVALGGTFKA